ncbi:hypothetical protein AA0614_0950 [Komagataeibacter saccharivorans NRIC 0614]|nr:hypothetical protein AA0614_0950 [Komagataeibacter saccharivorans NRIC 0614]
MDRRVSTIQIAELGGGFTFEQRDEIRADLYDRVSDRILFRVALHVIDLRFCRTAVRQGITSGQ